MRNYHTTVLLATYNRAEFVGTALDSVLSQATPPEQVIVINDGSTDRTREVLADFRNSIVYLEQENGGKASALNRALPLAEGDFLWIFDDDDIAYPSALMKLSEALSNHPDAAFAYGGYIAVRDSGDGILTAFKEVPALSLPDNEFLSRLMYGDFLGTPGMLFRADALRSVGDFDTSLLRCQDYDMKIRLARRFRGVRVEGFMFKRRYHDEGYRGGRKAPFSMQDFGSIALQYEGILFRKVRNTFGLNDFLPTVPAARSPDATLMVMEKRQALFRRMRVMAVHGLWDDAIEDLSAALDLSLESNKPELTPDEKWCCRNAMSDVFATRSLLSENRRLLHRVRTMCLEKRGAEVLLEFAKGLIYVRPRLCAVSQNERVGFSNLLAHVICAMRMSSIIMRLLGVQGLFHVAREKILPSTSTPEH